MRRAAVVVAILVGAALWLRRDPIVLWDDDEDGPDSWGWA